MSLCLLAAWALSWLSAPSPHGEGVFRNALRVLALHHGAKRPPKAIKRAVWQSLLNIFLFQESLSLCLMSSIFHGFTSPCPCLACFRSVVSDPITVALLRLEKWMSACFLFIWLRLCTLTLGKGRGKDVALTYSVLWLKPQPLGMM